MSSGEQISNTSTAIPVSAGEFGAPSTVIAGASVPRRRKTRNLETIRFQTKIGAGMYGVVYRGVDSTDNATVALKKINMERETQGFPVTALREIKILHSLNHKNVVHLREVVTYGGDESHNESHIVSQDFTIGDVFMVFEYVEYDLSHILKARYFDLSPDLIKSFSHQLITGVEYLHGRGILHRDIKGANLLISRNNVLKIADLGLARHIPPVGHRLTNPVITLWYRSPEVILGSKFYGPEVDMWSIGCILGELWSRQAMFNANAEPQQLELIFSIMGCPSAPILSKFRELPDWEKCGFLNFHYTCRLSQSPTAQRMDPAAFKLMEALLDLDPEQRMKASSALLHEYFTHGTPLKDPEEFPVIDLAQAEADLNQRKAAEARQAQQQAEARRVAELQRTAAGHSISVPNREQRNKELAQNSRNRFKMKTTTSSNSTTNPISASAAASLPSSSSIGGPTGTDTFSPGSQQPPPPPYIGGDVGRDATDALEEINSFQPTIIAVGRGRPSDALGAQNPAKRPRPDSK